MKNNKYLALSKKIIMLGFGSIGQAVLPLLFRHLELLPSQVIIMTKNDDGEKIAREFGLTLQISAITKENYSYLIGSKLNEGDFLLNLTVGISSVALIKLCQEKGALYLDTCTEPWIGGYVDNSLPPSLRSNYVLREEALKLKSGSGPTAVLTHGANPGLVSHFVKQALWNMATNAKLVINHPQNTSEWAYLAKILGIKVIHIAEKDSQVASKIKAEGEFVNTWSVDGLIAEGGQPAELSWGTHERHWPIDGNHHKFGTKTAVYLNRPGASVRVRSWTPTGPYHGFLITHAESISIGNYLTLEEKEAYRPTVHYAYLPCPDARLSLCELQGNEWYEQQNKRIIFAEIIEGVDELGVLLMGNKRGAYWYGSQLSIHEARKLAPHNNATSLQVAAGILAGVAWAIQNPKQGVIEPEELDYQFILDVASPYLGRVAGYYTDWTPLKNRERLFKEQLDHSDPWQFLNIRVN
ncbi:homospermidine synthase [Legionella lansingensis]|uniref:Homospermidine synthase n=1 Tax=Legionella lansingensis TaxID=45067 RepID=A0A0W0VG43_9GAMM|nr:saccharopine dehydrogenase C-terminal domain-containing protein [Legionella lansingensis]KTD19123.1 homospermidine synthase [Legionella lansingensis]SNV45635.1 homospermidine synthase [Legionella lansingensis]